MVVAVLVVYCESLCVDWVFCRAAQVFIADQVLVQMQWYRAYNLAPGCNLVGENEGDGDLCRNRTVVTARTVSYW